MEPYTKRVIEVIKSIPEGKVMTYGQIAKIAGSKRGARQVARILHVMSKTYELPWHRVINAKGKISVKDEETRYTQKYTLEQEGVKFNDLGRIDLKRFQFTPFLHHLK